MHLLITELTDLVVLSWVLSRARESFYERYDTIFLFTPALGSFFTKSLESYMLELCGKVIKVHVSLYARVGKHNRSVSSSARGSLTML